MATSNRLDCERNNLSATGIFSALHPDSVCFKLFHISALVAIITSVIISICTVVYLRLSTKENFYRWKIGKLSIFSQIITPNFCFQKLIALKGAQQNKSDQTNITQLFNSFKFCVGFIVPAGQRMVLYLAVTDLLFSVPHPVDHFYSLLHIKTAYEEFCIISGLILQVGEIQLIDVSQL